MEAQGLVVLVVERNPLVLEAGLEETLEGGIVDPLVAAGQQGLLDDIFERDRVRVDIELLTDEVRILQDALLDVLAQHELDGARPDVAEIRVPWRWGG